MTEKKRGAPIKQKDFIICERIKIARTGKFTQNELANNLDVSVQTVKNWEQKRNIPDDQTLKKISQLCDVDFLWLKNWDIASIVQRSRDIVENFNPSKAECVSFPSLKEESRSYTLIYALQMCGYKLDDIVNKKQYSEYMESSIKNSIEFYMNNLNRKDGE